MAGQCKNILGLRFGRWTVIERRGTSKFRTALWLVRCDCGNEKILATMHLTSGGSRSCGCLKLDVQKEIHTLLDNGAAKQYVLRYYNYRAVHCSIEWSLTEEQFWFLVKSNCFYCGSPPCNKKVLKSGSFIFNGIDRIDNDKGYAIDNVVPCCKICNLAKRNLPYDEFISWLDRIVCYRGMVHSNR